MLMASLEMYQQGAGYRLQWILWAPRQKGLGERKSCGHQQENISRRKNSQYTIMEKENPVSVGNSLLMGSETRRRHEVEGD